MGTADSKQNKGAHLTARNGRFPAPVGTAEGTETGHAVPLPRNRPVARLSANTGISGCRPDQGPCARAHSRGNGTLGRSINQNGAEQGCLTEKALREADAGITNTRANVTVITSTHANVTVITPNGTTYVREWNGSRAGFDQCVRPVWFPDGYYADWYETLPNGTGYGHVAVDGNMVAYID